MSRFRPLRGRLWGVFDTPLRPGTCESSKNGSVYATDGGVWWGVCNTPLRLGTCCPSKNCPVFVPFGAACGAYAIRPTDRVCAILRNTDAILQLGMCGPSKNHPVFVPFGAACGAYAIRPYDWVRVRVQKMDLYTPPSVASGGRMRYAPTTGYVRSYEILIRSLDRRGGDFWDVGRWGLSFAGETGVNEFGEEEDDDQNNDNKGA